MPVPEVFRKISVSDATFNTRREKYGGLEPSVLKRLKQLEGENQHLKKPVADLLKRCGVSERQAGAVLQFSRASCRYQWVARDSSALSMRIREITLARLHYGYRRVHGQLQLEDWRDHHKRVYRGQGLSLRLKRPRRNKAAKNRQPLQQIHHPYHIWCMDFVSGTLFDGLADDH